MQSFPEWSPFRSLSISSHESLIQCEQRFLCPVCEHSRRYYCYQCYVSSPNITVPSVIIPIQIAIIKDPRELAGKSTAVHAKILCPEQVEIMTPDQYNVGSNDCNTVVLFPSPDALLPEQIEWTNVNKLLVIEGTWSQATSINKQLPNTVQRVKLSIGKTAFWRYQRLGEHCLSTIEAIHLLLSQVFAGAKVDDLLWFFSFQYHLIQHSYGQNNREFTSRHRPGYINK